MSDLTGFLLARVAEDEAVARDAVSWESDHDGGWFAGVDGATLTHIVRHGPARVLAECEAKRRIVQDAIDTSSASFPDYDGGYASAMEDAVAMLAQPYRDHPDFRPEWSDSPG